MKRKYKTQIFLTICIGCFLWGMLGGYIMLKNPDRLLLAGSISFILFMISLGIPIKIISNRARKDLDEVH